MNPSAAQELYSAFLGLAGARALKEIERALLAELQRSQPVIGYWKLVGTLGLYEQRVLDSLHRLCEEGLVVACRDGWRLTPEGVRVARGINESLRVETNGARKFQPNGGMNRHQPKGFFLDLRLRNPFYVDLNVRKPERLRRRW